LNDGCASALIFMAEKESTISFAPQFTKLLNFLSREKKSCTKTFFTLGEENK